MCRLAVNILNNQFQTADKGWLPRLGFVGGLATTHHKKQHVKKCYAASLTAGFFERT
jgi:hypothetical protein